MYTADRSVSHQPLTAETQVQYQVNPHEIYGGQIDIRAGLSLSSSFFFSVGIGHYL